MMEAFVRTRSDPEDGLRVHEETERNISRNWNDIHAGQGGRSLVRIGPADAEFAVMVVASLAFVASTATGE